MKNPFLPLCLALCLCGSVAHLRAQVTIPWGDVDKTGADATTSVKGVVQLADQATGLAGTDTAKVPPVATVQAMLANATATRATVPYFLHRSGRQYWSLGAAGDLSSAPFSLAIWLYNDGIAKTSVRGIAAVGGSSGAPDAAAQTFLCDIEPDDSLRVRLAGTASSNLRYLSYSHFSTKLAVGWHLLTITWDRASAPLVSVDGTALTMSEITQGGSPPAWTDAIVPTYYVVGARNSNEPWIGGLVSCGPINAVLSPAEITTLTKTGLLPDWCVLTGSNVSKIPSGSRAAYGAADGTTGYSASGSGGAVPSNTSVAGARDGGAGAYVWEFTSTGAGSGFSTFNFSLEKYRPYFVRVWARRTAGTVTTLSFGSINQGAGTNTLTGLTTSWQQFSAVMYALVANGEFSVGFGNAGGVGDKFQLDDLEIYPMGPVIRPTIQPGGSNGGVIHDLGDNHLDGVYTAGVTPVTDATRGSITATVTWAGTHEAKALLADQALLPPNARIDSITVTASAATSGSGITLNDGDTTSYWSTATALTANTKTDLTPAHRFPASSGTADLKIQVDPDTANYTGSITVTINYSLAN